MEWGCVCLKPVGGAGKKGINRNIYQKIKSTAADIHVLLYIKNRKITRVREVLLLPYHVLQLQSTLCFNAAFISSVRLFVGKTLNLCVCVCRLISGKRWDAACPEHHKAPQKLFIEHRRTTNNRKPSRCCKLFCQVLVSHLNHKAFEVHWSLKDSCRVEHTILLVTARAYETFRKMKSRQKGSKLQISILLDEWVPF